MFNAISLDTFEQRTGIRQTDLGLLWGQVIQITSLKNIVRVLGIQVMPVDYLERLIFNTTLEGKEDVKPYRNCSIQTARVDPHNILIGQTFVERPKYQMILEKMGSFFDGFCVNRGFAKCAPLIVLGEVNDGSLALAHYIPPLVEEHPDGLYLLDGTHRNFLIRAIGTTVETVIIKGVKTEFPCRPQGWASVKVVDQKPPREERFHDFKPEFFRDLKWVGIDG